MQELNTIKIRLKILACLAGIAIAPGCQSITINSKDRCHITPKFPDCNISITDAKPSWVDDAFSKNERKTNKASGSLGKIRLSPNGRAIYARYKPFRGQSNPFQKVDFELRLDPKEAFDIKVQGRLCSSDNTIAITRSKNTYLYHFVKCNEFDQLMTPYRRLDAMGNTWMNFASSTINLNKDMLKSPIWLCFKGAKCVAMEFLYYTYH